MLLCKNCKINLEADTVYCPGCGCRLGNGSAYRKLRPPTDPTTRAILIEARALKARSLWSQAVEKCMAALKKDPENPEIFLVLGEIYEAQERLDQAIQWYRMAEQEYAGAGELVSELQERIHNLESRCASINQTTGWFDRYVVSRRFRSSVRVVTYTMVGFLLLLILGAVFVVISDSMMDRSQLQSSTPNDAVPGIKPHEDKVPLTTSSKSGKGSRGQAGQDAELTLEQKILSALMQNEIISQRHIIIHRISANPKSGLLVVEFNVSPYAGRLRKSHVLSDSAAVVNACYTIVPNAEKVTVHAFADLSYGAGRTELQKVFSAGTVRETAAHANPNMTAASLRKIFTDRDWNERVME